MASEHFCLKWNNFQSNIITNLDSLKCDGDLVDVTLTCEGRSVKAHKVILSACSTYFRSIFKENPCPHPIVILKGVTFTDLSSLISFMYQGEVHIHEEQLSSFLRTAEHLQIRGLADVVSPDEMPISETLVRKEQNNKDGNSPSLCPSSDPEILSPPQSSPYLQRHETEAVSSRSSPGKTFVSKSTQSMSLPCFSLAHRGEMQSVHSGGECSSVCASGSGNVRDSDVWRGGEEEEEALWRVDPKQEPMDGGDMASQEPNEGSERMFDWHALPASGSESVDQRQLATHHQGSPLLNSQISITSANQDQLSCFPCPLCNKIISSKSNLQKHIRIRHSLDATQERCLNCGKVFKNKYSLKYHSTYHCIISRSHKP